MFYYYWLQNICFIIISYNHWFRIRFRCPSGSEQVFRFSATYLILTKISDTRATHENLLKRKILSPGHRAGIQNTSSGWPRRWPADCPQHGGQHHLFPPTPRTMLSPPAILCPLHPCPLLLLRQGWRRPWTPGRWPCGPAPCPLTSRLVCSSRRRCGWWPRYGSGFCGWAPGVEMGDPVEGLPGRRRWKRQVRWWERGKPWCCAVGQMSTLEREKRLY